jgi:hypothetical protein
MRFCHLFAYRVNNNTSHKSGKPVSLESNQTENQENFNFDNFFTHLSLIFVLCTLGAIFGWKRQLNALEARISGFARGGSPAPGLDAFRLGGGEAEISPFLHRALVDLLEHAHFYPNDGDRLQPPFPSAIE